MMHILQAYFVLFTIKILLHHGHGKMFDSEGTLIDSKHGAFPKNECFNTSAEMTSWLTKVTSGAIYKRFMRPGLNESALWSPALFVNVSLDMNSIASMDDINSEYTILLKIDLEWLDERLRLTSNHCNTTRLSTMPLEAYHLDRIWYPRLGVSNIKDPDTSIIQGDARMILGQLRSDGYIHIRWALLLRLVCYLDFALFPFDRQVCFIKLESRSSPKRELQLVWHESHPFRNLENFHMSGFKLVNYQIENDNSKHWSTNSGLQLPEKDVYDIEQMSQIVVRLVMKREWINYFLEIYVPSILCVVSSWLSFWLQINSAPARVSLGMTTMLTLVTSSQSTRDKLPRLGYIHALDVWIAFCICLIFLSLIEFAIVTYIQLECNCKKREKQRKFSQIFTIEEIELNRQNEILNLIQIECRKEKLAIKFDKISRIIFPAIFLLFNLVYWIVYLTRKAQDQYN